MASTVRVLLVVFLLLGAFAETSHARWYDPQTGRFLERDPLGSMTHRIAADPATAVAPRPTIQYTDGMNVYQAVRSQPTRRIDSHGTQSSEVYIECRTVGNDPNATSRGGVAGALTGMQHCAVTAHCGGQSFRYEMDQTKGGIHHTQKGGIPHMRDGRWSRWNVERTNNGLQESVWVEG
jgi:hypothetical protein